MIVTHLTPVCDQCPVSTVAKFIVPDWGDKVYAIPVSTISSPVRDYKFGYRYK